MTKFSIDWPPGFVSQIRVDPRTKRMETDFARQQRNRKGGGFDRNPLALPGAVRYLQAGPMKTMEKP